MAKGEIVPKYFCESLSEKFPFAYCFLKNVWAPRKWSSFRREKYNLFAIIGNTFLLLERLLVLNLYLHYLQNSTFRKIPNAAVCYILTTLDINFQSERVFRDTKI